MGLKKIVAAAEIVALLAYNATQCPPREAPQTRAEPAPHVYIRECEHTEVERFRLPSGTVEVRVSRKREEEKDR